MCLTGIFPFIEPFRYTESATIFKIQLPKENICTKYVFWELCEAPQTSALSGELNLRFILIYMISLCLI